MVQTLFGTSEDLEKYKGLVIKKANLDREAEPDRINIEFVSGGKIFIYDNGQSCCEHRYITCDDDFDTLLGGKLLNIEVKKYEDKEADYDVHEKCFVEISTDKGFVTFTTHNKHNGYYGGFGLTIVKDEPSEGK